MNIPEPIYNHILSLRPTHPIAKMVKDFKNETINDVVIEIDDLEYLTFMEIAFYYDGDFWQALNGISVFNEIDDGNEELMNDKIIKDFRKIYIDYGSTM